MISWNCAYCGEGVPNGVTHSCPQSSAYGAKRTTTLTPDPLERIATALEQLVQIFKQAEDTQNRRLPRDA